AEGVRAFDPAQVFGERVVVAAEGGCRVVTDVDESAAATGGGTAADADLVDLLKGGLPDVDAEVVHIGCAGERPARGVFNLIADVEVVEEIRREGVGFGEQGAVIADRC